MKNIILIAAVLSATQTMAQVNEDKNTFMIAGFNAGYSSHVTAGLQFGVRTGNVYLSVAQIIAVSSDATTPKVFTANAGYNIGPIQPFISYGYQTIGRVSEAYFHGTPDEFTNGFRLGYGVSYYFKEFPLSVTAQRQGKINNFSIGMYKTL